MTRKIKHKEINMIDKYIKKDMRIKLLVLIVTFSLFGCATIPEFVKLRTPGVEIIANDNSFRISPRKNFIPNDFSPICDSSNRGAGFKNGLPFVKQLDVGIKNKAIPVTIKFDNNDSLQGLLLFCKVDTNHRTKTYFSIKISKCKADMAREGKLVADYELSKISRKNHFSAAWILWMAKDKSLLLHSDRNKENARREDIQNSLAFSEIKIGDPLYKIKKNLSICEDPRPISWLIPSGPSTAYYFDDQGVYLFFDKEKNVQSMKFFRGYAGKTKSIRIGDSLGKIIKIHGKPHNKISGSLTSNTKKEWMYGSGSMKVIRANNIRSKSLMGYIYYEGDNFYRFDVNPQTEKVQVMFSGKNPKPNFLKQTHKNYGKITALPLDGQNVLKKYGNEQIVSVKNNTIRVVVVESNLFVGVKNETSNNIVLSLDDVSANIYGENKSEQKTLKVFSYEELLADEEERFEFRKRVEALKYKMANSSSATYERKLNELEKNRRKSMSNMLHKQTIRPGASMVRIVKVQLPEATSEQRKIIFVINIGGENHEFTFSQRK